MYDNNAKFDIKECYGNGIKHIVQEYELCKKFIGNYSAIQGLDSFNRLAIFGQQTDITDIQSEIDWVRAGRRVMETAEGVRVCTPVYRTTYTYVENGETVERNDLSPEELRQAVQLGVIHKENELVKYSLAVVYDISETIIVDPQLYAEYDAGRTIQGIDIKDITEIASVAVGLSVEQSSMGSYLNKDSCILFLQNNAVDDERIKIIVEAIGEMLILKLKNHDAGLTTAQLRFVAMAVECYIQNKLGIKSNDNMEIYITMRDELLSLGDMDEAVNNLVSVLDVAIECVDKAISIVMIPSENFETEEGNDEGQMSKAERRIEILSKASKLVAMLEACAIRNRMDF